MAQLQSSVAKLEAPPAKIPPTMPLKAKPASGKLVVYMSCNVECTIEGDGVKQAAADVGWNFKQFIYQITDPATLVSAMRQALQLHPDVVITGALPYVTWQSVVPAYKAAGVPIVTYSAGAPDQAPFLGEVLGLPQYHQYGVDLADWFIVDSQGKGHAVITGSTNLSGLNAAVQGFESEVAAKCPACKITYENLSILALNSGGAIPAVVSAVQRDPSINYAITSNGSFFTGLAAKLGSLGLGQKVKIAGVLGTANDLANVKAGTEAAWVNFSITQIGWQALDIALRHAQGMPLDPGDSWPPSQLLVHGGDFTVSNSTDAPADYATQFKALWKVS
jgi:ribose transport system substrate-binding protein